jgi:hypothetical protein
MLVFCGLFAGGCGKPAFAPHRVPAEHPHARLLLDNAWRYTDPAHGLFDVSSGYPVEGWNQEPKEGLYLRSFTQLTAIGAWVELLASMAAGQAENPYRLPDVALDELEHVVTSLLSDQADPALSAGGLLSNFIGLEGERRLGPLASRVDRGHFVDRFGQEQGATTWEDLAAAGWIELEKGGSEATVKRSATYGLEHFDGLLAPYHEAGLSRPIMEILDARVVNLIFGDNVNLTASVAKAIGALLDPSVKDDPRAVRIRDRMDQFIERQGEGYRHLYDEESGQFAFGWNATEDRFTGWELEDGTWVVGRMNYLINEFRGGWTLVVLRFGFPDRALLSAEARLHDYRLRDGRSVRVPAAWDGSAFQILGLSLFMQEMQHPEWSPLLRNAVEAELDYAERHGLPGLLSESYSGNGSEYTGAVGIPELAVTKEPRITDAPSLYTLGVAYQIAPDAVESFLAAKWSTIGTLLTDHGPWEGYKVTTGTPIRFQTCAHTLSLILGFVGAGDENMVRYLITHDLMDELHALGSPFAPGTVEPDAWDGPEAGVAKRP